MYTFLHITRIIIQDKNYSFIKYTLIFIKFIVNTTCLR